MKLNRRVSVLTVCWCTYVLTYLCRVNFSSAMEKLITGLNTTPELLGRIGSCFFLFYAVGQLVNGLIGDRISPYKMVMLALMSTSLINLCVSRSRAIEVVWILWSLNGFFQSMIWGPLMRILAQSYSQDKNTMVSSTMSTSMVAGFLLSWVIFGRLFIGCSWKVYFLIPSALAIGMFLYWKIKFSADRAEIDLKSSSLSLQSLKEALIHKQLWVIVLVCFGMGLMKESLSLWAPLLMTDMLHMDVQDSFLYISIIPVANFGGIILSRFLMDCMKDVKKVLFIQFAAASICSVILFLGYKNLKVIAVLLMAIVSGMMYGSNSILLSYIPISFRKYNIVSSLVGCFDFTSYLGAAVSSLILGISISNQQYERIFFLWFLVSSAVIALISLKFNFERKGVSIYEG